MPTKPFMQQIKKAWQDTLMPLHTEEQREQSSFVNYLLGWPEGNKSTAYKLMIYIVALRFIIPVVNLFRRPIELLLNVTAAALNWSKESLQASDSRVVNALSYVAQGFQILFKTAFVLLRSATAPVTHLILSRAAIDKNIENPRTREYLKILNWALPVLTVFTLGMIMPTFAPALVATFILEPIHLMTSGVPFSWKRSFGKPVTYVPAGDEIVIVHNHSPGNQLDNGHRHSARNNQQPDHPADRQPSEDTHAYEVLSAPPGTDATPPAPQDNHNSFSR